MPNVDLVVISSSNASLEGRQDRIATLRQALQNLASAEIKRVILISSGAIVGPDHHLAGFVADDTKRRPAVVNPLAEWWELVEQATNEKLKNLQTKLVIMRCPFVIGGEGSNTIDQIIARRWLVRYVGFNPPMQFLSIAGLTAAIQRANGRELAGTYNVAPDDVVPLRPALKALGVRSFGVPRCIQRLLRPVLLRFIDGIQTTEEIDYFRYPWTLSGTKFKAATGLNLTSQQALTDSNVSIPEDWPEFDAFGADKAFYERHGKSTFRFIEKAYWRIESRGFNHFPSSGSAIIVGPHRGFMPLDAVMMFHLIHRNTTRRTRFLIHPTLVKFPFQGWFFQKMATMMACRENATRALENGELLGVYPEGIRGAFKMHDELYQLGRFGRPDYARFALEFDVPVIPFAIVGSGEIFPILHKIKWRWLKKYLEWPYFPITPTFPFLPFPLPTKWHVDYLAPIYPAEVRLLAEQQNKDPLLIFTDLVRDAIITATQKILAKRKSVYWGNAWQEATSIKEER